MNGANHRDITKAPLVPKDTEEQVAYSVDFVTDDAGYNACSPMKYGTANEKSEVTGEKVLTTNGENIFTDDWRNK